MLINNAFSDDNDENRLERLLLISENIDTYAAELSIAGDLLSWAQDAGETWETAVAQAVVQDGEMDMAYEDLHKAVSEAYDYYVMARDYLTALIWQVEKPNDMLHTYGFEGKSPRTGKGLVIAISAWKERHDHMVANSLEPVVSDAIMDQLLAHETTLKQLGYTTEKETDESSDAYKLKFDTFATDSAQLSVLFTLSKLIWGHDNSNLRLLGFVPSSEVWTENKPPHPKNFVYDDVAGLFNWDAVEGVDSYEVDFRLTGASGDWTQLYKGAATSTADRPPDPGEYDFRIRSWHEDDSGAWSGVIVNCDL